MNEDIHVPANDTWPPLLLADGEGPINLTNALEIRRSIDGGEFQPVVAVNADRGLVPLPALESGDHTVEFEIDWELGATQIFPSSPQKIIAG